PLGKFDGKADEGFLVGYSASSSGPTWLFDIDTLTRPMNYQPVTACNLPNPSADFSNNSINEVNAASTPVHAIGKISTNSTNTFSVVGPSNTDVRPTLEKSSYVDTYQYPDDPNMPALEDITYSDDD
nr:hypothetical protein [Tanacetum cinerariifolium]